MLFDNYLHCCITQTTVCCGSVNYSEHTGQFEATGWWI